jgi:hypothetical protein
MLCVRANKEEAGEGLVFGFFGLGGGLGDGLGDD